MTETEEISKTFPGVPVLSKEYGYGVATDGCLWLMKANNKGDLKPHWVCDGYARISEEMRRENGDAVFIIEGMGAKDSHEFRFEMDAKEFAEGKKLKQKLTAQFGACNQVGGLKGEVIQQISLDIKKFRLIETPRWLDGKAAVPGLDLIPNLRYAANSRIPVNVDGGSLSEAQQSLVDLLASWDKKLTTVAYAALLGSPVVARWYPGDRFGLVIRGLTGSERPNSSRTQWGPMAKVT
jgi:hypothetical protein